MTTNNGIAVVVNPDSWVSAVAVNLWYGVGSVNEPESKTGFAHLFEHLMFSGSSQVASGEHLALLQAIGANVNATTSHDRTNYFETVPKTGLELALWLEADRLSSLLDSVNQTNLDTQREVVKEEKRLRYDNVPYGDAFELIMQMVFPAHHPYAHTPIGSMTDLDAASLADVHGFFNQYYRPNNLVLTMSGAVAPDEGFALVDKYFSQIPATDQGGLLALDCLGPLLGDIHLDTRAEVPQDVIYCCWRVPPITDLAYDHFRLGLSILSGSISSRLHQGLVRTGLADSVDTFDMGLKYGNSVIVATLPCAQSVSPEAVEEAMNGIWEEFCQSGPSQTEMRRAKKAEERDFFSELSSIEDRADQISAAWSLFGDPESINQHLDKVRSLIAEDVAASFSTWVHPDNRAVLTYRSTS